MKNRTEPNTKYIEDFIKLQSELASIQATKINPVYKNKYMTIGLIMEAIRKPLTDCNFAVVQNPLGVDENDLFTLETIVMHKSGYVQRYEYKFKPTRYTEQGLGSALTYARRYTICSIFGIVADEDDDGNAASAPAPRQEKKKTDPAAEKKAKEQAMANELGSLSGNIRTMLKMYHSTVPAAHADMKKYKPENLEKELSSRVEADIRKFLNEDTANDLIAVSNGDMSVVADVFTRNRNKDGKINEDGIAAAISEISDGINAKNKV